jgi:hypothetical protein
VSWNLDSEFGLALSKFEDYFCNETLTTAINDVYSVKGYNTEIKLRGKRIRIAIRKINS